MGACDEGSDESSNETSDEGCDASQEGFRGEPAEEVEGDMQGGAKGAQHQGLRPLRRQDCPGEGAVRQDQKHPCGKMIVDAKAFKPLSLVVMLQGVRAASFSGRLMKSVCVMGAPK